MCGRRPSKQAGETMAWISVHESVVGPKLRNLYYQIGCSQWEAVGILCSVWLWGLNNAEKSGFIPYAGKEEIARCLYGTAAGSTLDPTKIVDALIDTGWLDEADQGLYLHDWDTWQEQWYKAIERRENEARRKRESRKRIAKRTAEPRQSEAPAAEPNEFPEQMTLMGEYSEQPSAEPVVSSEQPEKKYSKGFEEFWAEYPRPIGKGEAYKKYMARRNDGFSEQELLTAAKNYAAQCRRLKTDQQYIKHAKTFLSENTPFVDYIPKEDKPSEQSKPDMSNPFAEFGGET